MKDEETTVNEQKMRRQLNRSSDVSPKKKNHLNAGDADKWQRVHVLSPFLRTWKTVTVLFSFIGIRQYQDLSTYVAEHMGDGASPIVTAILVVGGILIAVLVIMCIYSVVAWRFMGYAIGDETVTFRSGILFKTQHHIRLDRIQAIDIVHPLMGRIFGVGAMKIESAGGMHSSLTIEFLCFEELQQLRAQILAQAAGLKSDTISTSVTPEHVSTSGDDVHTSFTDSSSEQTRVSSGKKRIKNSVPVASEQVVCEVPTGRLMASVVSSSDTIITVLCLAGVLIGAAMLARHPGKFSAIGAIIAMLPAVIIPVSIMWHEFSGNFGFRLSHSADGIRIRTGLLDTNTETIPPRRVHAVRISQPILWRLMGWYKVTLSQAGIGLAEHRRSSNILLPVGTWENVLAAVSMVTHDIDVDDPASFLKMGIEGAGTTPPFVSNPPQTKFCDPLTWKRRAIAVTDRVIVIRDGRLTRRLSIITPERIQSMAMRQGPLQRLFHVATVNMDIVFGKVSMKMRHMSEDQAVDILEKIQHVSQSARSDEPPERWMRESVRLAKQEMCERC